MQEIERCVLLLIVALLAGEDLYCGRMRNHWMIAGCLIGLVFSVVSGSGIAVCSRIFGCLIPLLLLYVFFYIGGLGAGDIKLFAVVGSFVGCRGVIRCMMFSFFVAAIHGVVRLCWKKSFRQAFHWMKLQMEGWILRKKIPRFSKDEQTTIAFSVSILMSVWMYLEGWI